MSNLNFLLKTKMSSDQKVLQKETFFFFITLQRKKRDLKFPIYYRNYTRMEKVDQNTFTI